METEITWPQEAHQFFKHSYKALEQAKLMAHVSIDPEEALTYLQEAKAIGHIRFGLWLDINRPPSKILTPI